MKATGKPKTNHNAGWKARAKQLRREAAETRQKKYEALPLQEKLKFAGKKQRLKLEAKA